MKRAMRWAARLYPAAWRARYGAEIEALIEDMAPVWLDVWNVVAGAFKMQMKNMSIWKLVPALGMAGAIVGSVVAFSLRPVYESGAVLRVTPVAVPGENPMLAVVRRLDYLLTLQSRAALAGIVAAERLYPGETAEDGLGSLQRDIRVSLVPARDGHPDVLVVAFRYPDAIEAQHVVQKLTALIVNGSIAAMRDGQPRAQVLVLDAPRIPGGPIFPNRPLMIAVGLGAGLLLGALYCARSGWKVVLFCGAVGAPLGVYGFALALGRHVPQSAIRPLAMLGFAAGLLVGSIAVLVRRKPVAGIEPPHA